MVEIEAKYTWPTSQTLFLSKAFLEEPSDAMKTREDKSEKGQEKEA